MCNAVMCAQALLQPRRNAGRRNPETRSAEPANDHSFGTGQSNSSTSACDILSKAVATIGVARELCQAGVPHCRRLGPRAAGAAVLHVRPDRRTGPAADHAPGFLL